MLCKNTAALVEPLYEDPLEDLFIGGFGIVVEVRQRADHVVELHKGERERIKIGIRVIEFLGNRLGVRPLERHGLLLACVVAAVLRDFDRDVALANLRLAGETGEHAGAPSGVEMIKLVVVGLLEGVEAFADDHVAGTKIRTHARS